MARKDKDTKFRNENVMFLSVKLLRSVEIQKSEERGEMQFNERQKKKPPFRTVNNSIALERVRKHLAALGWARTRNV